MTRMVFTAYVAGMLAGGCAANGEHLAALCTATIVGFLMLAAHSREKRLRFLERKVD